jgi:hypothetical protein
MAEYLVYHGPFTAETTDPGILAIKADGLTVSVTGARQALAEWMPILENSSVLKGTVKNGKVSLESYVNANKYSTWTWFTDDEFDEFGKVYNSVKGSTKTFSVKPSKTKD